MNLYRFTPQAANDLVEIWTYIAPDNAAAADRVETAIYEACTFLSEGPFRGHVREDLTKRQLRFWTIQRYPNYIVVYDPHSHPLEIIRILEGMRNIRAILIRDS